MKFKVQVVDGEDILYEKRKRFRRHLEEMDTYISNNRHLIPNYGEKHRYGEAITTSFVESTINEVISKRMAKKQQMQWTHEGAHYLLQTRTATLNDDLKEIFERWYGPRKHTSSISMEDAEILPLAA